MDLYQNIWKSQEIIKLVGLMRIPETIIILENNLQWYFYKQDLGLVMRKRQINCNLQRLRDHLKILKFQQQNVSNQSEQIPLVTVYQLNKQRSSVKIQNMFYSEIIEFLQKIQDNNQEDSQIIIQRFMLDLNESQNHYFKCEYNKGSELEIERYINIFKEEEQQPKRKDQKQTSLMGIECNKKYLQKEKIQKMSLDFQDLQLICEGIIDGINLNWKKHGKVEKCILYLKRFEDNFYFLFSSGIQMNSEANLPKQWRKSFQWEIEEFIQAPNLLQSTSNQKKNNKNLNFNCKCCGIIVDKTEQKNSDEIILVRMKKNIRFNFNYVLSHLSNNKFPENYVHLCKKCYSDYISLNQAKENINLMTKISRTSSISKPRQKTQNNLITSEIDNSVQNQIKSISTTLNLNSLNTLENENSSAFPKNILNTRHSFNQKSDQISRNDLSIDYYRINQRENNFQNKFIQSKRKNSINEQLQFIKQNRPLSQQNQIQNKDILTKIKQQQQRFLQIPKLL